LGTTIRPRDGGKTNPHKQERIRAEKLPKVNQQKYRGQKEKARGPFLFTWHPLNCPQSTKTHLKIFENKKEPYYLSI
jgi:hypothetical protein